MNKQLIVNVCGFISIFGVVAVIICNIIGVLLVKNHNPIADTISALAIGKSAWIQDVGLDLLALGFLACALALFIEARRGEKSNKRFIVGCILLVFASIAVLLIAEHNQYAGRQNSGTAIHIYVVIVLGLILSAVFYLMQPFFNKRSTKLAAYNKFSFWSWIILAPIFFVIPNGFDGLYERLLALIPLVWMSLISVSVIKLR